MIFSLASAGVTVTSVTPSVLGRLGVPGPSPYLWQLTEPVAASALFWTRSGCATEGAAHAHPSRACAGEDQAPWDYETTQRWEGQPAGSE